MLPQHESRFGHRTPLIYHIFWFTMRNKLSSRVQHNTFDSKSLNKTRCNTRFDHLSDNAITVLGASQATAALETRKLFSAHVAAVLRTKRVFNFTVCSLAASGTYLQQPCEVGPPRVVPDPAANTRALAQHTTCRNIKLCYGSILRKLYLIPSNVPAHPPRHSDALHLVRKQHGTSAAPFHGGTSYPLIQSPLCGMGASIVDTTIFLRSAFPGESLGSL